MRSFHQRVLAFLPLAGMIMGGCAPATSLPRSSPTQTIAPTLKAIETHAPVALTLPPSPSDYLDEIFMTDATSGWACGLERPDKGLLLHTSDGGQTWMTVTPLENVLRMCPPNSAFFLDTQTAWVILGNESLVRTSDGGQTWDIINHNLKDELVVPWHEWYILHFANVKHGWLEAGYSAAGGYEFYYETQDGGASWHPLNFASWPPDLYTHHEYPNELAVWTDIDATYYDSGRFIIAPGGQEGTLKMFLSPDWGKSWKTVQLLPSVFPGQKVDPLDRQISEPIFFDPRNGVVTVTVLDRNTNTTQLFVYGTSDGGLTWTLLAGPSLIHDLHSKVSFLSPQDGVLICGSQFCVTHDSGTTWRAFGFGASLSTGKTDIYSQLNFIDPTMGWLLQKTFTYQSEWPQVRLLKTTDGGVTWTELSPVIMP